MMGWEGCSGRMYKFVENDAHLFGMKWSRWTLSGFTEE